MPCGEDSRAPLTPRGLRRVRHGGAWAGYRAELLRYPEARTSVAVLCNLGSTNPSALADAVGAIVMQDRMSAAAPASPPVAPQPGGAPASSPRPSSRPRR